MTGAEGKDVDKGWQRYLDAASGVTEMTKKTAERVVQVLVQQGEVAADKAERYVDDLLARSEQNRKSVAALVRAETEAVVARLGLARQEDLDRLAAKVARLEAQQRAATTAGTPGRKTAAEKRAAAAGRSGGSS